MKHKRMAKIIRACLIKLIRVRKCYFWNKIQVWKDKAQQVKIIYLQVSTIMISSLQTI